MKVKIDKFTWALIIFALILISAYIWVQTSHIGIDYSQCVSKRCLTNADLLGGVFIELTFPIFIILVVIKIIIIVVQAVRRKV